MLDVLSVAGLAGRVVTVKLVAEGLSQELAGLYNTAYGYLQLFGILADFGLYAVAIREMSTAGGKKEQEKVLGNLIVLRCGILALSIGSALGIAWLVPSWSGTPLPLSITIAALVPSFTLLAGILRTVFQVHHKMQFVFVAEVLQRVLTAGVMAAFVWMGVRGTEDPGFPYLFLPFVVRATGSGCVFPRYTESSVRRYTESGERPTVFRRESTLAESSIGSKMTFRSFSFAWVP